MFQEVIIHQSFQPNCVQMFFTFLMISKLKLFQIGTNDPTLELSLKGYKIDYSKDSIWILFEL